MRTALYEEHVKLHAKIVDFAGWEMPLQYASVLAEHAAVRSHAGLFDVSHMGVIHVLGQDASSFLQFLSTNSLQERPANSATYTVFCHENGGSVDDTILYKLHDHHFFLVANASNRQKDLNHLKKYAPSYNVTIEENFSKMGILALQGPMSLNILETLFPVRDLKPMRLKSHQNLYLSRTGYTGELGFEIFAPNELLPSLWKALLEKGAISCGLGARDTLRLEKGYALYGHELSDEITPNESVAFWTIKEDHDFLGKQALKELKNPRHSYGLVMEDKEIPRQNCEVFKNDAEIGYITSGNFSPSLKKPIALFLTHERLQIGDRIAIKIRGKMCQARVCNLPFF